MRVSLSTANSDFWVYSSLQNKTQLEGHNFYTVNPDHIKKSYIFITGYNGASDYDAVGRVYTEKVTIGGLTAEQAVGAAVAVSQHQLNTKRRDGMVGLGDKTLNTIQPDSQNTFIDNVKSQLAKKVFAITTKITGSIFDFGFIDPKKYTGSIAWVDNFFEENWSAYGFYGSGFSVGPSNVNITPRKMNIHLDSASTVTYVDPDIITSFYGKIKGAKFDNDRQYWTIPCNSNPPDFTVVIGGQKFVTPGCHLISINIDDSHKMCIGGLQNIGGGVDFSLFGINWFRGKYVVFDVSSDKVKLGFAKEAGQ
ncbi:hypothetical protein ACJQWK_07863 [Exserohilum turcicum]